MSGEALGSSAEVWEALRCFRDLSVGLGKLCEGLGRSGEALGSSGELWGGGGGGHLHGMSISIRLGDRILLFSIRSAQREVEFGSERV